MRKCLQCPSFDTCLVRRRHICELDIDDVRSVAHTVFLAGKHRSLNRQGCVLTGQRKYEEDVRSSIQRSA